jgi:hypothetical protein
VQAAETREPRHDVSTVVDVVAIEKSIQLQIDTRSRTCDARRRCAPQN